PTVSERSTEQEEEVFPDNSKVRLPLTDVSTLCQHLKERSCRMSAGSIEMDPTKVEAVKDRPVLETRKAVQQILGFVNYYRQFIQGYSSIDNPLHQLTSSKKRLIWNPEAQATFSKLKDSSLNITGNKGEEGDSKREKGNNGKSEK
ncbi:hypothetical protein QTP70_026679, partial [Hemibagrus guttatus]